MWRWSARASRAPGLSADADGTADQALTRLYAEHSRSLLRLAALLVNDAAEAEEITQAAFAATHDAWQRLGTPARQPPSCAGLSYAGHVACGGTGQVRTEASRPGRTPSQVLRTRI
jgi:predicted RNA polymerase sigma factor